MIQQNASDLHLKVGRPPVLRVHGDLSSGAKAAYLFAAFVLGSPLGLVLALVPRPVYAFYAHAPRTWGAGPLVVEEVGRMQRGPSRGAIAPDLEHARDGGELVRPGLEVQGQPGQRQLGVVVVAQHDGVEGVVVHGGQVGGASWFLPRPFSEAGGQLG